MTLHHRTESILCNSPITFLWQVIEAFEGLISDHVVLAAFLTMLVGTRSTIEYIVVAE